MKTVLSLNSRDQFRLAYRMLRMLNRDFSEALVFQSYDNDKQAVIDRFGKKNCEAAVYAYSLVHSPLRTDPIVKSVHRELRRRQNLRTKIAMTQKNKKILLKLNL